MWEATLIKEKCVGLKEAEAGTLCRDAGQENAHGDAKPILDKEVVKQRAHSVLWPLSETG